MKRRWQDALYFVVASILLGVIVFYFARCPLVINSEIPINNRMFVVALGGSNSNTAVGEVTPNGRVKFIKNNIKRNRAYALVVTDGTSVYWDGKVEIGILGDTTVEITPESASHRLLSSDFIDLLFLTKLLENK